MYQDVDYGDEHPTDAPVSKSLCFGGDDSDSA